MGEIAMRPEAADADYAQFAKRDLDKLSWLAPLVNNRLGELLCVQLRHEHLFFVREGEVIEEVGYGEDGRRFHERDKGKEMRTFEDMRMQGYWFVAPRLNARAAFDALGETRDGAYYSVFSNQCQDWARRVRRRALAIQAERSLPLPEGTKEGGTKPLGPTVPAASYLGMLAIVIGAFGLVAPAMTGFRYLMFVAVLLAGIGISDLVYAVTSKAWESFLSTVAFGLLALLGAGALWINSHLLLTQSNAVLAVVLAVAGGARVLVALRSRPFSAWWGTLATGLLMVLSSAVAWVHRDGEQGAWLLGVALSLSFISAGASTIWLNGKLTRISHKRSTATCGRQTGTALGSD
jgi:uncharacterized membrane protein HdeD (DUF308 family)